MISLVASPHLRVHSRLVLFQPYIKAPACLTDVAFFERQGDPVDYARRTIHKPTFVLRVTAALCARVVRFTQHLGELLR